MSKPNKRGGKEMSIRCKKEKKYMLVMNLGGLHNKVYELFFEAEDDYWVDRTGTFILEGRDPCPAKELGEHVQLAFNTKEEAQKVLDALLTYQEHVLKQIKGY